MDELVTKPWTTGARRLPISAVQANPFSLAPGVSLPSNGLNLASCESEGLPSPAVPGHSGSRSGSAPPPDWRDCSMTSGSTRRRFRCGSRAPWSASIGAALVGGLAKPGDDAVVAELIAYAVAAITPGCRTRRPPTTPVSPSACRVSKGARSRLARRDRARCAASVAGLRLRRSATAPFRLALLGRMIFSCLVDADSKDTEAFYCAVGGRAVDREWPSLRSLLPRFLSAFDA